MVGCDGYNKIKIKVLYEEGENGPGRRKSMVNAQKQEHRLRPDSDGKRLKTDGDPIFVFLSFSLWICTIGHTFDYQIY